MKKTASHGTNKKQTPNSTHYTAHSKHHTPNTPHQTPNTYTKHHTPHTIAATINLTFEGVQWTELLAAGDGEDKHGVWAVGQVAQRASEGSVVQCVLR